MSFFDTFKPRDYQVRVHNELRTRYDAGKFRFLVRLFTGAGKTTGVAAFLPKIFPELLENGPLIFLSHRREILFHAYTRFKGIYPDKFIGIEMGEYRASGIEDMIFVSVDSLGRLESSRLKKYKNHKPGIILCDEGHHVTEKGTWDRILSYFDVGSDFDHTYKFNGHPPLVIFLTATPNRGDGLTLESFVDDYEIDLGIDYGIDNGWLVRPELYDMHLQKDGRNWGEMDEDEQVAAIAKIKETYAIGQRTLVFAPTVSSSKRVASTLNELGIGNGAGHVDAKTDKEERDTIVKAFERGDIETLSNRLIFTEGYDNPYINVIIDSACTQSDSLFEQKIGRGLRPLPGLVDHLETKEERLAAIAASSKPCAVILCTYDTSHLKLSPEINIHQLDETGNEKMPLCAPVVDVIIYEEELPEEVPPRSRGDLDSIELFALRRDVWTGTIYNNKLKAITTQRWVLDQKDQSAALWIPKDPDNVHDTPFIWYLRKWGEGWEFVSVDVGGWSHKRGHARKAGYEVVTNYDNFGYAIRSLDTILQHVSPSQYTATRTDAYGGEGAGEWEMEYLKNNGIKYGTSLTDRSAHALIDNHRIQTALSKLGLIESV